MANIHRALWSATVAGAICFGCGGGADGEPATGSVPAKSADPVVQGPLPVQIPLTPPAAGGTVAADLKAVTDAAFADASRRSGRPVAELAVKSAESVTWTDGGLGCPQPGVMYTMAPVDGYRIRIEAGGEILDYHASRRGHLVYCPPGRAIDPLPGGST